MSEEQDVNYLRHRGILYLKAEDVIKLLKRTEFSKKELAEQLEKNK